MLFQCLKLVPRYILVDVIEETVIDIWVNMANKTAILEMYILMYMFFILMFLTIRNIIGEHGMLLKLTQSYHYKRAILVGNLNFIERMWDQNCKVI